MPQGLLHGSSESGAISYMRNCRRLFRALQWLGMLDGRIGRLHYWLLLLASIAIVFVAATMGSLNPHNRPIQWLSYGILLSSGWPVLSATTRRLRDADLSFWYGLLLIAVPTAFQIAALVFASKALVFGVASALTSIDHYHGLCCSGCLARQNRSLIVKSGRPGEGVRGSGKPHPLFVNQLLH